MREGQTPARRGRRPGRSGTREAILRAARRSFSERGYDSASLREIATQAEVDPALVHHYFRGKAALFQAAMRMPDLENALTQALQPEAGGVPPRQVGERIVRMLATLWSDRELPRTLAGLMRSAATNERAAAMLREFLGQVVLARLGRDLPEPDRDLRVALVGSQVFGLLVARTLIKIEPIASMPVDELVAAVGPTLQRYLTADLRGSAENPSPGARETRPPADSRAVPSGNA